MNFQQDDQFEYVWISPLDPLPTVCCSCGMFTDHRVRIKHVELVQKSGKSSGGCLMVMITILVHVALGPLGWLISILLHGKEDENGTTTVKEKTKMRLPQCQLCAGMAAPEVVDSHSSGDAAEPSRLMFRVHPQFKRRFEAEADLKTQ